MEGRVEIYPATPADESQDFAISEEIYLDYAVGKCLLEKRIVESECFYKQELSALKTFQIVVLSL